MTRAKEEEVLSPERRRDVQQALKRVHKLVGRMDQFEACGTDCTEFRNLANYLVDFFGKVQDHVIDGKPVERTST